MDYTEINSHLNGVQSALISTAMDLQRANVGYGGIQNLVEKQLNLIKAVCDQLEVLEKRLEKIERDNAL